MAPVAHVMHAPISTTAAARPKMTEKWNLIASEVSQKKINFFSFSIIYDRT